MKSKDSHYLSSSQYASADKLNARWKLYDSAIPEVNIHHVGIDHLKLTGNEAILEVGCGDGSVLVNLQNNGHQGRLVGLEITEGMFLESLKEQKKENRHPPIEFIVGSADTLPFPDKSFDIILAFFMLYHMADIQKTLLEWSRVLQDNGKIILSTSSQYNKPKHKQFKKLAEKILHNTTPPQFSSSFNMENAQEQLKHVFTITDTFVYKGQVKLEKPDLYMNAFNSIRDMYEPIPNDEDWKKVITSVQTEIENEVLQNGFFTDQVQRGFFICEKV